MPTKAVAIEKSKKHYSKAQISAKKAIKTRENALKKSITPPDYLSADQKKEFNQLVEIQSKLGLISQLDIDSMAAYVIARDNYSRISAEMNAAPVGSDEYEKYSRLQDRYFKQMRSAQSDLGMNPESRNRLSVPNPTPEDLERKANKFDKFIK